MFVGRRNGHALRACSVPLIGQCSKCREDAIGVWNELRIGMGDLGCLLQISVIGSELACVWRHRDGNCGGRKMCREEVDHRRMIGKNSNWGRVERV